MSSHTLTVALVGAGPVVDRLAERIDARPDLRLVARTAATERPPAGTDVVVYVPTPAELAADAPREILTRLLRDGHDVVSTLPAGGPTRAALREACAAGESTYHATGAFQSAIGIRSARSLSEVTRDIRRVDLVEELVFPTSAVHPWDTLGDNGISAAAADAVADWYEAGLRVLDEAVFAGAAGADTVVRSEIEVIAGADGAVEKVVVDRELGPRLGYRSVWTVADEVDVPLRYRLTTSTPAGRGTATIEFRFAGGLHPADHLTCVGVLDALRPVHDAEPGIAHRDPSITALIPDARLVG
ncbi:hypothetical protein ACWEKT_22085 [Nocardia takedensis]